MSRLRSIFTVTLLLIIWCGEPGLVVADHLSPITVGFGANGSYRLKMDRFPSPLYKSADVSVFRPIGAKGKVPVVFFVPGYSNNNPEQYRGLITHMVSRGQAVVFTPYHLISGDLTLNEKRYDAIWEGMREAVARYGEGFDLDRIGYVGHSYGAGAIFAMSLRGIEQEGWGREGLILFSMAPWYHFQLQTRDYRNFPVHAKLVIQVYEDDKVNDHRLAWELFEQINLPLSEKDFMMVRGDRMGRGRIDAGHGAPESRANEDAIDFYAIYRTFDGLTSYAFAGDQAGRRVALGNGNREQRFMGHWSNGQPIREMLVGDCVGITRSPMSFLFPSLVEWRRFSRLLFSGREKRENSTLKNARQAQAATGCDGAQ
jgi:pimeloyl-ACP methyl ester carboxylesterase